MKIGAVEGCIRTLSFPRRRESQVRAYKFIMGLAPPNVVSRFRGNDKVRS